MNNRPTMPNFEKARSYALHRLETELAPELTYHSLAHTRDDILPGAERLAQLCGMDGETLLLLRTAAAFHDLGYIVQRKDHESVSAQMARDALPRFGYSPEQIEEVVHIIMATQLPQTPHSLAEQILADADLDVLGREDFWEHNIYLRAEMEIFGPPFTDEQWYETQIQFLSSHSYFTDAAQKLRNPGKQRHIEELKQRLEALHRQDK